MRFSFFRPLHGWREFVHEIIIVVLGVLIALGAGQILQSWQWRRDAEAARDALRKEAADNLHAADQRIQLEPCIDRRLKEIAVIFADHAAQRPIQMLGPIGRPVSYYGSTDAWKVEIASQALSHMPLDEKLEFSTAFANYEGMNDVLKLEQGAWLHLGVLDSYDQLQAEDWPALRQAYAEASSLNGRLRIITHDVASTMTFGQAPTQLEDEPPAVTAAIRKFCEPILPRSAEKKG
jgi:hypothetical protein